MTAGAVTGSMAADGGFITVDLDALAANYRFLRGRVAPAACAAVVKANAYGLGIDPVARRLAREGCESFFVAHVREGSQLRAMLPEASIYVLEGPRPSGAGPLLRDRLVPVLNSMAQVREWSRVPGQPPCALHIDTGMARLGMPAYEARALAADAALLQKLQIGLVMTHLACADMPEHSLNAAQLQEFRALCGILPAAPVSIANSAGALLGSEFHGDLARPGIALYGGNPISGKPNPMREVVSMFGPILQVRRVRAGVPAGYGATWRASTDAVLATVGIGYADGYPRALGNRAFAMVGGVRVPVVGRVSMDSLILDVTALPEGAAREGAIAQLLGGGIDLDALAELAGTISYELLTRLGERLHRRYRP
jgi:alanine racemase